MTFAFSDLFGLFWVFAFPAFLHILNAYNGRNRGITAPRSPAEPYHPIKTQRKRAISQPGRSKLETDLSELHKSEFVTTHKRCRKMSAQVKPTIRAAPVTYTPQDTRKPAVTLARPWVSPCCILPIKAKPVRVEMQSKNKPISAPMPAVSKPVKFKKARNFNRKAAYIPLTKQDRVDMDRLLGEGIFKKINYMSVCWLKTRAVKAGIDDWISLLCSKSNYEDNKLNLYKNFGAPESEDEQMQKYRDYSDMARDEYKNN